MRLPNVSSLIVISVILFSLGCKNKYENAIIGKYKVFAYDKKDTVGISDNIPILTLKDDKTFSLMSPKKQIAGEWEADDDGDRTWIRFYFNSIISDGFIGGDSFNKVIIWNPQDFSYPHLEKLSFLRIK